MRPEPFDSLLKPLSVNRTDRRWLGNGGGELPEIRNDPRELTLLVRPSRLDLAPVLGRWEQY
ncbi:MAG: hypothetical protein KDA68_08350, partial [Planctomycetaceae bacterium]|nr:hypothetical protein [Planctomycetaceae bacterium]